MKTRSKRYLVFALMVALTAVSVALFPRININSDMTEYLPSDSRMKSGVDTLKAYFPEIDMNAFYVKAMFSEAIDKEAKGKELCGFDGVSGITAVSEKDNFTLFQLSVSKGSDPKAISEAISERYGEKVIVENNANSIMPDNMVLILIIAVIFVFGILFLMCSSFVEALLFILTIGMAVAINMGTNAFLPSVSMLTNTIGAVLQLVLSMDYSIILMNRFRQVNSVEPDIDKAMSLAIRQASPSILSSSLTTIVGLLALVFMKFKIGLDLGLVLAKGVFCSLVSIYTILPVLILVCYKGVKATEKKVFLIPTDRLAGFEMKFRIPLAILFVTVFISSWFLSRRTELSYASIWESRIAEVFPPQNAFSLLYRTSDESNLIELADSLAADNGVTIAISYPSLMQKKLTAPEMCAHIGTLMEMIPAGTEVPVDTKLLTEDNLRILYYAATHPERNERMSLEEMLQLAEDASGEGLLPEGMDVQAMVSKFMAQDAGPAPEIRPIPVKQEKAVTHEEPVVQEKEAPSTAPAMAPADSVAQPAVSDSLLARAEQLTPPVEETGDDPYGLKDKYAFTKENINRQMNSAELAEFLGFSKSQASTAYAMAGRKGKNGKMSPYEFISYMTNTVLKNKLLRKMISEKQAEGLYFILDQMNAVQNEPEPVSDISGPSALPPLPPVEAVGETLLPVLVEEEESAASPALDELAMMFASGNRYSSAQICKALQRAGIDAADAGMIDLMFIYYGSRKDPDGQTRLSVEELVDFLSSEVAVNEAYSCFLDDSARTALKGLKSTVNESLGALRKDKWSMAALVTDYPLESGETFDFIERAYAQCTAALGDDCILVGESVMYKEMKDGFKRELLILTLITVLSIFLIVAITFRSALIPTVLVMSVMTGVFVNVYVSGIGGNTMLYLAYLIVQSILMGSTIDYGILFTSYYRGFRHKGESPSEALKSAYRGSIHTIMTSGLIIVTAPYIMSLLLTDPTICSILSSITYGAVAAISLILFVLPAMLAACDSLIIRKKNGQ